MKNTEQILNRLFSEKDRKENLQLDIEKYNEIPGQKVIVRSHLGNSIWHYHTHSFYEINYVLKGGCINLVEEEPVFIDEGDFILMNPGTYHIPYCDSEGKILNFIIDAEWFLDHFTDASGDNPQIKKFIKNSESENYYRYLLFSQNSKETKKLAEKIISVNNMDEKKKYLLLEAAMVEFFCSLIYGESKIRLSKLKGVNTDSGRKLINYLTNNYKNVTLEKTAEYARYSKTHICRIFKDSIGKSFSEVLTDIRLEHAKYALLSTDKAIKEIAEDIGYGSVEYFQRLFKRQTGITPGDYRKNHTV